MSVFDIVKLAGHLPEIQKILKQIKVDEASDNGDIRVIINGQQKVLTLRINSKALKSNNGVEIANMLSEVFNLAQQQSKEQARKEINKLTGVNMDKFKGIFF